MIQRYFPCFQLSSSQTWNAQQATLLPHLEPVLQILNVRLKEDPRPELVQLVLECVVSCQFPHVGHPPPQIHPTSGTQDIPAPTLQLTGEHVSTPSTKPTMMLDFNIINWKSSFNIIFLAGLSTEAWFPDNVRVSDGHGRSMFRHFCGSRTNWSKPAINLWN